MLFDFAFTLHKRSVKTWKWCYKKLCCKRGSKVKKKNVIYKEKIINKDQSGTAAEVTLRKFTKDNQL